jgi:hypothetical protein
VSCSSGPNPSSITFYTDKNCVNVATSTVTQPFTSPGTMAALEYPCLQLTATTSISAGTWNEALHGIGSVFLWTKSGSCQGLSADGVTSVVRVHAFRTRAMADVSAMLCCRSTHTSLTHSDCVTRCLQVNFSPNDGECVRPDTIPQNEFSAAALGGRPVSWRFFLDKNSNACKHGVTTAAMVPTSNGGVRPTTANHRALSLALPNAHYSGVTVSQELYGLCANNFQYVSPAIVACAIPAHHIICVAVGHFFVPIRQREPLRCRLSRVTQPVPFFALLFKSLNGSCFVSA